MGKKIDIPVEPYLKKFLIHSFGEEPIPASKFDPLCLLIYSFLQTMPYDYKPVRRNIDDYVVFELFDDNNLDMRNVFLKDASLRVCRNIFNSAFYDSLRKFVFIDNKDMGNSPAIDKFLKKYGLTEDDINKESLLKNIYRFKHNKTTKRKKFMLCII